MNIPKFASGLKFKILARSMTRLGLDPNEVDDREEAVRAIYDRFAVDGLTTDYECDSCKGDIPDIDFCPFCGVSLVDEEEDDIPIELVDDDDELKPSEDVDELL